MTELFIREKYREEERLIGPSLDAIERAHGLLRGLGDQDTATFFTLEEHKAAWARGAHDEAALHLFWDSYNWLKFYWWTTVFKIRQLCQGLIHSYNSDNHLCWLILARSTLEYAAVSYYVTKKVGELKIRGPEFRVDDLKAFEDVMIRYSQGTRFNWADLMAGNIAALQQKFEPPDSTRAINVMTALEHLSKRNAASADVKMAYEMLSDFAHPNMASHVSVSEMPASDGPKHAVRLSAKPQPRRGEFIAVVSLPWVSLGIGTAAEVLIETAGLLETWLEYVDEGKVIKVSLE